MFFIYFGVEPTTETSSLYLNKPLLIELENELRERTVKGFEVVKVTVLKNLLKGFRIIF